MCVARKWQIIRRTLKRNRSTNNSVRNVLHSNGTSTGRIAFDGTETTAHVTVCIVVTGAGHLALLCRDVRTITAAAVVVLLLDDAMRCRRTVISSSAQRNRTRPGFEKNSFSSYTQFVYFFNTLTSAFANFHHDRNPNYDAAPSPISRLSTASTY